jgi:Nif-specific regulatory protein
MASANPYLLIQRDEGYGEVFPLDPQHRYTMGRAPTSQIVVKDELCSREHSEVYFTDGQWYLRDLGSLNGTRLNGQVVNRDTALQPQDEVRIGKTKLLYLENMIGVPPTPETTTVVPDNSIAIRKRLGDTRFQQMMTDPQATAHGKARSTDRVELDLARLYQLALRMRNYPRLF